MCAGDHLGGCIMSYSTFTLSTAILLSFCSIKLLVSRLCRKLCSQDDVPVADDEVVCMDADLAVLFNEHKEEFAASRKKSEELGIFRLLNEFAQAVTGALAVYGVWRHCADALLPFAIFLMWKTLVRTFNVAQFTSPMLVTILNWDTNQTAELEKQIEAAEDKTKKFVQEMKDLPLHKKCLFPVLYLIGCALFVSFYAFVAYVVYAYYASLVRHAGDTLHVLVE